MKLEDLLNKITADLAGDSGVLIEPDTELLMSGVIDSLGVINLVTWLEDQTNVEIDPGDVVIEHFETPSAIVAFVATLTQTTSA